MPGDRVDFTAVVDFATGGYSTLQGLFNTPLLIHQLEFQQGRLADEVNCPLWIFDAGQLDQDTVFPLGSDVRLTNSKLVNPVADGLQPLVYCQLFYMAHLAFLNPEENLELVLDQCTVCHL